MKAKFTFILAILVGVCSLQEASSEPWNNKFQRVIAYAERAEEVLNYKKAAEYYEEAQTINPSKEVLLKLAVCYQKLNETDMAIARFEQASEFSELSKAETLDYGKLLIDAGRYEEARKILKAHVDDSYWVKDKIDALEGFDAFYQYEDAYIVNEVPFNTTESEFSPTVYEHNLVVVASRDDSNPLSTKYNWDNSSYLDLFKVGEDNSLTRMDKKINTRFHEGPAVFFDNNNKIIFTRNQFDGFKNRADGEAVNHLKLFYSEKKTSGKWSNPKMLPFNRDGYSFGHPAINETGTELYFASNMENGKGGTDLYKVTINGKEWSDPVLLHHSINTEKDELFPFYQDGTLYFASDGLGGLGGLDIYKVDLSRPESKPRNLGAPINTRYDDFGLVWMAENQKGYFSSNREGGTGKDDVYEYSLVEHNIMITLKDAKTDQPVQGNIQIVENSSKEMMGSFQNTQEEYIRTLHGARLYVSAKADGYEPAEQYIDTKNLDPTGEATVALSLKPIKTIKRLHFVMKHCDQAQQISINEDGSALSLTNTEGDYGSAVSMINNIYYDLDKYALRKEGILELNKLIALLTLSDAINIRITGHTDPSGSAAYNQKLSEKRVDTVRQYLIKNGIKENRIFAEGLGESQADGSCGELGFEQLRRTEVEIIVE